MTIFKAAVKRILSSKIKLLLLFICPALFMLMFVSSIHSVAVVAIADNDRTELSESLIDSLERMGIADIILTDEGGALDKTMSYQVDAAFIIQKGFEDAVISGNEPMIDELNIIKQEGVYYVSAAIENYVADMQALAAGAGYDRQQFQGLYESYEQAGLSIKDISGDGGMTTDWTRGGLGFLVQFMLYMSIITTGVILEDRSSGVYYRVFFAPVTLKRYMAENLLMFMLIGSLQAVITLALMSTVLGMPLGNAPAMVVLFIVFAFVCISLGMSIITLFKKPLLAYLSTLFLTTPLVMLGGCYWPQDYMPDTIVKIGRFIPTSWAMQAADKVLGGAGVGDIAVEIAILLLFAAIFLAAGLVRKVEISR